MVDRVITKQLAGKEDLLLGTSTQVQPRGSGDRTITELNAIHIPVLDEANLFTVNNVESALAEAPA